MTMKFMLKEVKAVAELMRGLNGLALEFLKFIGFLCLLKTLL
jgi:hypothetical protein